MHTHTFAMTPAAITARKLQTADARRVDLLAAAQEQFALQGYWGTPTTDIAKAAGISQAYLFRLFGTKRELFIACVERCMGSVREAFERAGAPHAGDTDAVLDAMGDTYAQLLSDRTMLLAQLQSYAACGDPEIRAAVQEHYGRLVDMVRRVSGADDERVSSFFATGLLLTVVAAMGAHELDADWARALLAGKHEQSGC